MGAPVYGVRERAAGSDRLSAHIEEIEHRGFTVIDGGFDAGTLERFRSSLESLHEQQIARCGGADAMRRIGEYGVVRAPLAFDEQFLAAATHDDVLAIAERMTGGYVLLTQQNGNLNTSGDQHSQSAFHRDLPYQHFTSSRPLALNALLCLDDFTAETGATAVLPGSHRVPAFPSDDYVARNEVPVTAPAGSYLIMDGMLYHRAGRNVSGRPRRALNHVYAIPLMKQQIVLPALLEGKWADRPELARLLGYESDPARSVDDYIAQRAAKAQ